MTAIPAVPTEVLDAAKEARLRYVDDRRPGIRRRARGKGFVYEMQDGSTVRDPAILERIAGLVIPPAWTDVWICTVPNGHVQATGRDAKGRKQYLYHPRWREVRDSHKFERVVGFVDALPTLRTQVEADLALRGLPRDKVIALIIELMGRTLIRIGNRQYAVANGSYGLTTLRDEHVEAERGRLVFDFVGKHGKEHRIELRSPRLARLVRKVQDLPGHELFQFVDEDGSRHTVESADVNEYLRRVTGEEYTAKDFRTWGATVAAAAELCALPPAALKTEAKRNVSAVIKNVARRLGNTPALCRKAYVHPVVPSSYLDGTLVEGLATCRAALEGACPPKLDLDEAAVAAYLRSVR
ncbi:DNA topoisomerase IB [Arenibaculum pallidiluteum]|uniref:DNA topoisomerase IB n=1 Tax=Arenibaculum pallidiluteum TaxID=2812559 RepID=UPI001A970D7A|nr:DNA topoisomerase IB [Arenibaculum pallidiluteum]